MKKPVKIAVTGAAGAIGYEVIFRIAAGDMLGQDQPILLHLLEIEAARKQVEAVVMELEDCAYPLLRGCTPFFDPFEGFSGVGYAILIGARPRTKGMERKDLLQANAQIFSTQGRALNESADRDVRTLVVGNPANTNALIALRNAPDLPPSRFASMLRLDHNRAIGLLARHVGASVSDISNMTVWGNHSATQFPDLSHCKIAGKPALDLVHRSWFENEFIPAVQQRGARVIKARGSSSAASAASAIMDHMRTWVLGTVPGDWTSMGVFSEGDYDTATGLVFSYPLVTKGGEWQIVQGLPIDAFCRRKIKETEAELWEERNLVQSLLQ